MGIRLRSLGIAALANFGMTPLSGKDYELCGVSYDNRRERAAALKLADTYRAVILSRPVDHWKTGGVTSRRFSQLFLVPGGQGMAHKFAQEADRLVIKPEVIHSVDFQIDKEFFAGRRFEAEIT